MEKDSLIYVAGHRGLVGSAIIRRLRAERYGRLLLRTSTELDLTNQAKVERFFDKERPEYVFLAAAKVGGIMSNSTWPAEFIYRNLMIEANVIHAAYRAGVEKLLFLGSSCIYPKLAPQPLKEEYLLTGSLEPTNAPYAVAKIAGVTMCEAYNRQYGTDFVPVMPTNLYGEGDNFDLETSHVLPALIQKFDSAKECGGPVVLWGTGSPYREFLHVDDLADACLFLMVHYREKRLINIGTGEDLTIRQLSELVQKIVGYEGEVVWDSAKPDGTPRKLLDVSRIEALGWRSKIGLEEGIRRTYEWYKKVRG